MIRDIVLTKVEENVYEFMPDKEYDTTGNESKIKCRPILLFHNIQTVINQNLELQNNKTYRLPVFYKFPFHLYKKEKWDIEHIDSNIENNLEDVKDQIEWLKASYSFIPDDGDNKLKEEVENFIDSNIFNTLRDRIIKATKASEDGLDDEEKNKIWNFTLLDSSTNKSYGNSIFPVKRRVLIGKDRGKKIYMNDKCEMKEKPGSIAFVPPCTKNVFLKYYSTSITNLTSWTKSDARAYLTNIESTLDILLNLEKDKANNK